MAEDSSNSTREERLKLWNTAWSKGETGWHFAQVNQLLVTHYDQWVAGHPALAGPHPRALRTFFPLCGKSLDMLYVLEKGHYIVGLDGVRAALDDFSDLGGIKFVPRHPLESESCDVTKFEAVGPTDANTPNAAASAAAGKLTYVLGDLFETGPRDLGRFDCIFDRGSLVAIKPALRKQYVELMDSLLDVNGRWLIVHVTYKQEEMDGPPFATSFEDIQELVAGLPNGGKDRFTVEKLAHIPVPNVPERLVQRGLRSGLIDQVTLVTKHK